MTIPIVPGPFSFLASAGQTAGNYLSGRRQRELQDQDEANKDLQSYLRLVEIGVMPRSSLVSPQVQNMFARAGIELPPGLAPVPSAEERKATTLTGLPQERFEAAAGIPSGEAVRAEREQKKLITAQSIFQRGGIAAVPQGGAAARKAAGVVPEAGAAAAEAAAQAGAEAQAAAAATEQATLAEVDKGLKEPEFARWAAIAKAGFLPLYLQRIASNRAYIGTANQEKRERARLLVLPLQNAETTFKSLEQKQQDELAQIERDATAFGTPKEEVEQLRQSALSRKPNLPKIQRMEVQAMANNLFPEISDPKARVRKYFAELKSVTGIINESVTAERLEQLRKAAQTVKSGTVSVEQARQRITQTAKDATIELVEFERLLGEMEENVTP